MTGFLYCSQYSFYLTLRVNNLTLLIVPSKGHGHNIYIIRFRHSLALPDHMTTSLFTQIHHTIMATTKYRQSGTATDTVN